MATITSANSVLMLAISSVYPAPQKIEGYATDDAFASDAVTPAVAVMGVDGRLSAGYTPVPTVQTITLQADSPSLFLFETWASAMEAAKEVFFASGTLYLPSIDRKFTLINGVLTQLQRFPSARKTLEPMAYQITWESVIPTPAQ
ncbi:phage tail fiber protein [Bordetella sp. 02P26C-1]|uniref:phage tail fiber protein n=1 Tax=Bordetella sp. 02P26C-1 TaxID=2683195 RepID=UPI00135389C2|nr:hypothetical protein [Bordetella sp. 02P26C-1]MVW80176.1 hypothetical protein [Bordetella sp. 02P26C-1]